MGRKTRAGQAAGRQQRRVDRWQLWLSVVFALFIALPAAGVTMLVMERFGTTAGPGVLATGTATVSGCEHHVLGVPYRCAAAVVWHPDDVFGEPAAQVTVDALRPLSGVVEVRELNCGRNNYVYSHTCEIYPVDHPKRSHLLLVPPAAVLLGLMFVAWLVARRIARRLAAPAPPA